MRAFWDLDGSTYTLTLRPDAEDTLTSPRKPHLKMLTNQATVRLPFEIDKPHPDLLAIAAFSIAQSWTARRFRLNIPVSEPMTEVFAGAGVEVTATGRVDQRAQGNRAILSYSGGADSIATGELLPADTPYVHLERVKHPRVPNRMTHVRGDVLVHLVRRACERGKDVHVVRTDLEYLCGPWATYPMWWAISIGSILLADHFDGGAVAMGTILEARYLSDGLRWEGRDAGTGIHPFYEAAGIPMLRPATGMTEVLTAKIAMGSDLADLSRSCMLGSLASPCMECEKCLRKSMIQSVLTGEPLPPKLIENMTNVENPQMLRKLTAPPPIFLQDTFEYLIARLDVTGTPLADVKERLHPSIAATEWVEHYYGPALVDEVPELFRAGVASALAEHVEMMTEDEVRIVETWDPGSRPASS